MPTVRLDGRKITDWPSFHHESQAIFGFPDFYGRNMSAWIDSLSSLRDGDGMSAFTLAPDETLQIELINHAVLRSNAPHIFDAIEECTAEVNERYTESGEKPALRLVLN
ncbi:MAG: barstar family protein [Herminiimonas sp.]|jgi:RNAse (barnase) inhibitor barstar|nr:barstar family protein [Herminiimonas sp.]